MPGPSQNLVDFWMNQLMLEHAVSVKFGLDYSGAE